MHGVHELGIGNLHKEADDYELKLYMIPHSPTRLNKLGSDGQVDCKWVGYRDLEDGVSLDSQHVGGYLEHALGTAQDSAKNSSQREKACQDKVRT